MQASARSVISMAIVFVLAMTAYGSWFIVDPGFKGIITRAGGVQEAIYDEGFHFKLPLIETAHQVSVQTITDASDNLDAGTKDLQAVHSTMAVQFSIDPTMVKEVYRNYRNVDMLSYKVVQPAVAEVLKAVVARYEAAELLTKRQEVHTEIVAKLREKLQPHWVFVKDVNITNFKFSKGFDEAVEAKVTAEQNAQKALNDLARIKTEGEQAIVTAKANAEAIRVQAEAVMKQGGAEYVQLQAIAKWDGRLPQYNGAGAVPFVNIGK